MEALKKEAAYTTRPSGSIDDGAELIRLLGDGESTNEESLLREALVRQKLDSLIAEEGELGLKAYVAHRAAERDALAAAGAVVSLRESGRIAIRLRGLNRFLALASAALGREPFVPTGM